MGSANEFRGAAKFGVYSGRRDLSNGLAPSNESAGKGLRTCASFNRYRFSGEHGLIE